MRELTLIDRDDMSAIQIVDETGDTVILDVNCDYERLKEICFVFNAYQNSSIPKPKGETE